VHLGEITPETTDDEFQTRFNAAVAGYDTPAPPPIQPPVEDIPLPKCAAEGIDFRQPQAEDWIHNFCSGINTRDARIVPPISLGDGNTRDGIAKVLGVSQGFKLEGTSDKLWLALMFAREGCTGSFSVSLGNTTEEKVAYCKARFRRILNVCHTNTITAKKGGVLREKCAEYFLTARPEGERPFKTTGRTGAILSARRQTHRRLEARSHFYTAHAHVGMRIIRATSTRSRCPRATSALMSIEMICCDMAPF
jgi:hypothetical protein